MKNVVVVMMLVLSLGVVAAYDVKYSEKYSKTYYFGEDFKVVSKTAWVGYDTLSGHKKLQTGNEKRYSTGDYRHGYSYRTSGDYFEKKYSDVYVKKSHALISFEKKDSRDYYGGHYFSDSKRKYHYDYVPYLRSYEKRECYVTPPRDKLFYIRC